MHSLPSRLETETYQKLKRTSSLLGLCVQNLSSIFIFKLIRLTYYFLSCYKCRPTHMLLIHRGHV